MYWMCKHWCLGFSWLSAVLCDLRFGTHSFAHLFNSHDIQLSAINFVSIVCSPVFCIHIPSVVCWLMLKEMKQLIMDWPREAHSKDTKVAVVLRSIVRLINLSSNQIVVCCHDPSSCDVVCAVSCLWVGEDYVVQSSNLSMADFFCFAWGRWNHVCPYFKNAVKVKFLLCTYQLPLKLLPVICNSSSAVASRV
jgi:hypothetical protein